MYRDTSLSVPSQSGDNEGPRHKITDKPEGDIGPVLYSWRLRGKVGEYVKKLDAVIALSKSNEDVKNIIKEYLSDSQFDEKKYQKNINKASNIVDNWEDGFPVRKNKTEADLKEELELDDRDFLDLKEILPKEILTILKYLTVMRAIYKEIQL